MYLLHGGMIRMSSHFGLSPSHDPLKNIIKSLDLINLNESFLAKMKIG